jgi:hypothetical protein
MKIGVGSRAFCGGSKIAKIQKIAGTIFSSPVYNKSVFVALFLACGTSQKKRVSFREKQSATGRLRQLATKFRASKCAEQTRTFQSPNTIPGVPRNLLSYTNPPAYAEGLMCSQYVKIQLPGKRRPVAITDHPRHPDQ